MSARSSQSITADVESVLGPAPASSTQPEFVVLQFRRHGRRLAIPVILMIGIAGVAGFWVGALPAGWMNLAAAAGAAVVGLLFGIFPVIAWLTRRTTVTTRRVIVRHGVFVHHRSEVALARVREVRARRNLVQRLWGSGDIELHFGAEHLRLIDAPGVGRITEALQDLMERSYLHESRVQEARNAQGAQAPGAQGAWAPQSFFGELS